MRLCIARFIAAFTIVLASIAGYMCSDWLVGAIKSACHHFNYLTEVRLSSYLVYPRERGLIPVSGNYLDSPGVSLRTAWMEKYNVLFVDPDSDVAYLWTDNLDYLGDNYTEPKATYGIGFTPTEQPILAGSAPATGAASPSSTAPAQAAIVEKRTPEEEKPVSELGKKVQGQEAQAQKKSKQRKAHRHEAAHKPKPKPMPLRTRLPSYPPSSSSTFSVDPIDAPRSDPRLVSDEFGRPAVPGSNTLLLLSGVLMFIAALLCAPDKVMQRRIVAFVLAATGCGIFTHLIYLPMFNCLIFALFLSALVILRKEKWLLAPEKLGLFNIWIAVGTLGVLFVLLQVDQLRQIIYPSKTIPLFLQPLVWASGLLCLLHCGRTRNVPSTSRAVKAFLSLLMLGWLLQIGYCMAPSVYQFFSGTDKLAHSALQTGKSFGMMLLTCALMTSLYLIFLKLLASTQRGISAVVPGNPDESVGHSFTNPAPAMEAANEPATNRLLSILRSNAAEITFYFSAFSMVAGLGWIVLAPGGLGELTVNWLREAWESSNAGDMFHKHVLNHVTLPVVPHLGRKVVKLLMVAGVFAVFYPYIAYLSALLAWAAKRIVAAPQLSPLSALATTIRDLKFEITIKHRFPNIRAIGCTINLYAISCLLVYAVSFFLYSYDRTDHFSASDSLSYRLAEPFFDATYAALISAFILTMILPVFLPRLVPRKLVVSSEGMLLNKAPYWRIHFRPLRQWSDVKLVTVSGERAKRLRIEFRSGGSFQVYLSQIHPADVAVLFDGLSRYATNCSIDQENCRLVERQNEVRNAPPDSSNEPRLQSVDQIVTPTQDRVDLASSEHTATNRRAEIQLFVLTAFAVMCVLAACGVHPVKAAGKCIALVTPILLLSLVLRFLARRMPPGTQSDLKKLVKGKEIIPRAMRVVLSLADQLKPFLYGAAFISSSPTMVAAPACNWFIRHFHRAHNESPAALKGNRILLSQNTPKPVDPKAEPFWMTAAFSLTLAAIALSGVPAMLLLTVFDGVGMDNVMHVTSEPEWKRFCWELFYIGSVVSCLCPLVIRAVFLMPCDHMSWQSSIEMDSAGIRKGNARGWCSNLLFFSMFPAFYSWNAKWSEVERVEFAEAGFGRLSPLPDTLIPKTSWLYKSLAALAELTDAIVDRVGRAEWIVLRKRGDMEDAPGLRIQLWDLTEADRESLIRSLKLWAPSVPIDDAAMQHLASSKITAT